MDPESKTLHDELESLVAYDEQLRQQAELAFDVLTDPRLPREEGVRFLQRMIMGHHGAVALVELDARPSELLS